MARIFLEPSRTLMEFRLLPGLTTDKSSIDKISLRTPLVYSAERKNKYFLNIPVVSAAMQSVSGVKMGIELATLGGAAFIYSSQTIERQAEMIEKIKSHKAGFVDPETVQPDILLNDLFEITQKKRYSTFPVVDHENTLLGIITRNDYDVSLHGHLKVHERMILRKDMTVGKNVNDLKEANSILMQSHHPVLPIVDQNDRLMYLVFRKDIRNHLNHPYEVVDERKRLLTAAAINTHDYQERVPALANAHVDVLAIDSSDGYSVFQQKALQWVTTHYPDIPLIGGNIITAKGFEFLVENGARAVKVGMGGGSICITQEQKGTGRGLATAILEVSKAREKYFKKTGKYIPIIADGGIVHAKDIVIALALGADYVMMGRYFARMEESPTQKVNINNKVMKSYWGEGSARANQWKAARYHQMMFVEGVEGFVEYAGKLKDNIDETLAKIRASMSSCGVSTIKELHENAELEVVSALSIREGKVHDIYLPEGERDYYSTNWGD